MDQAGTDVATFYSSDERRRASEEVVYGEGWTTPDDEHATFRLTLLVLTGELVLVREPHPGGLLARYLDQLQVDQADADGLRVQVLVTGVDELGADALLQGWQGQVRRSGSLAWLSARVQGGADRAEGGPLG